MEKRKIVAVVSGGMDSITMLHDLHSQGNQLEVLSFNYGQRHSKELELAREHCQELGVGHKVIEMAFMSDLLNNSSLTKGGEVPEGHYEDENMKSTVVPARNLIMGSIAIGYAANMKYDTVSLGVHDGDHAIYPDCRGEFIDALDRTARLADYQPISVIAPYLFMDKGDIVGRGLELGVEYGRTWTCYKGGEIACGKCGSCQERLQAFKDNGVEDPLTYESRKIVEKS